MSKVDILDIWGYLAHKLDNLGVSSSQIKICEWKKYWVAFLAQPFRYLPVVWEYSYSSILLLIAVSMSMYLFWSYLLK